MPADPSSSASRKEARSAPHKRTYQACKACRSAKLRCDLGDPDKPSDPPCKRCMRTGRECVFGGVYQRRSSKEASVVGERRRSPADSSRETIRVPHPSMTHPNAPFAVPMNAGSGSDRTKFADAFSAPYSSFRTSLPSTGTSRLPPPGQLASSSRDDDFKFVRGETLENPADALRILAAAVEDERSGDRSSQESDLVVEPGRWNRWIPVRDGLLTADEASILLAFYGDKINPTLPLVPIQLFQPAYFGTLLREPILLAAMIATAARFLDLGLSFDMSEPSRSRIIQGKIVGWLLQRIGFITMGETSSRTIGTVEAFLILSEWPPRAQYLFDSVVPQSGSGGPSSKDTNPCRVYDDLSWTLIGLAVRIAQELELQNERTYINDEETEWMNHRRHNTWIYCLSADRHASVRLGRASLVQEMSMNWWDVTSAFTKIPDDTTFPFARPQLRWREAMGVAQLTHTVGLLQEMLYASPDVTNELIKTGRYESTLHRLKPELDANWHAQLGDLPPVSVFDSEGETFSDEELMEIRWRIEFDYVRLYGNAIAMRAAQDRLLRRHKHNKALRTERMFEQNVIRLAEGSFVIEAVDAATSLVKCGVTMQKKGILRYCPCRTFMRLVFASVFLMKAVAFGAVGKPEQEVVDLQYELISALRSSSPDDQHVSHHVSTLLSRVFPAMPQSNNTFNPLATPAGEQPSDPPSTDDAGMVNNSFTGLPWLGLDMPHNDANQLDWNSGIVSGFGYDPSSIVSDIEEMLRAQEGSAGGHSFFA